MSGRRNHPRVVVVPAAEGRLRLRRDVVVQRVEGVEVLAISREPESVGEILAVEMQQGHKIERLYCRVVESRPLIVDGNVRHRLRLQAVGETIDTVKQPGQPAAERA